jgi:hypothetical protein
MVLNTSIFSCFWCKKQEFCATFHEKWDKIKEQFPQDSLHFPRNRRLALQKVAQECGNFDEM